MNERIKELMGKTLDSEFSHTWDTMTYEGLLQFSEKFAQLIVRECMSLADLPNNTTGQWDHLSPSEVIANYFGVES